MTMLAVARPLESTSLRYSPQADSDAHLIAMWVARQRSERTKATYTREVGEFMSFICKPLQEVRLSDLLDYRDHLANRRPYRGGGDRLKASSQGRALAAVKSLISFGHRLGYLGVNVGSLVDLPAVPGTLAEKILSESEVFALIHAARPGRNRLMVRLMYGSGLRVSEVCDLEWRDVQANRDGGQIAVRCGKGGKSRSVVISARLYSDLLAFRPTDATDADPVFVSRKQGRDGHRLGTASVHFIVSSAAKRAGIQKRVSPHTLRHCHASHSLQRNCPIHVVQQSLGHSSLATTSVYTHALPGEGSGLFLAEF